MYDLDFVESLVDMVKLDTCHYSNSFALLASGTTRCVRLMHHNN